MSFFCDSLAKFIKYLNTNHILLFPTPPKKLHYHHLGKGIGDSQVLGPKLITKEGRVGPHLVTAFCMISRKCFTMTPERRPATRIAAATSTNPFKVETIAIATW